MDDLLQIVGGQAGVWGWEPLWDEAGAPYLAPDDGCIADEFRLWRLAANQGEVARYVNGHGDSSRFTMLIDAETRADTLQRICEMDVDLSNYYGCIGQLQQWMTMLTWAYVPLESDYELALVVAAQDRADWIGRLVSQRRETGQVVLELATTNGRTVMQDAGAPERS